MPLIDQSLDASKRICWARGDSDPKVFSFKTKAGAVVDISGETFTLSVDTLLDPPDALTLQFALTGSFVTDGTDGKVQFAPTTVQTGALTPGADYFYDLQRDTPNVKTLIKAGVDIIQDITKT